MSRLETSDNLIMETTMVMQAALTHTFTSDRLRSLNLMGDLLGLMAPLPGSLVTIDTQQILEPWQDFYPTIYTALDVSTHLQVGNIYLLRNVASSVDFLQFVQRSFPFRIREIRTPDSELFITQVPSDTPHRFSQVATSMGMVHSVSADDRSDPILSLTHLYGIEGTLGKRLESLKGEEVMNALIAHLSLHNDCRPLPTLNGLTPIQKLRTFPEYSDIARVEPKFR